MMPWLLFLLATIGASAQTLRVVDAVVSEVSGGPPAADSKLFRPGERVYLAFRVGGFKDAGSVTRVFLEYTIDAVDALDNRFEEPFTGRLITTTARPETRVVQYAFELPRAPWPGIGKFRIQVRDRLGETEASHEAPFQIASELPDNKGAFTVSDLRIYSSEYSEEPLKEAVFQAGESVWARFLLSGHRLEPGNRYKLSYGVTLRDRNGRTVLTESQAVSDSKESFYPRWYLPALVGVRLESTIRPGTYTLVIAAQDEIGNQRATAERTIQVR